jgi:hypothetical protein
VSNLLAIIDAYKDAHGQPSDASIARAIGITRQTLSTWRRRGIRELPERDTLHGMADFWVCRGESSSRPPGRREVHARKRDDVGRRAAARSAGHREAARGMNVPASDTPMAGRQTGRLWAIVQEWLDAMPYPPSQRKLAARLQVSSSVVTDWKYGSGMPLAGAFTGARRGNRRPIRACPRRGPYRRGYREDRGGPKRMPSNTSVGVNEPQERPEVIRQRHFGVACRGPLTVRTGVVFPSD